MKFHFLNRDIPSCKEVAGLAASIVVFVAVTPTAMSEVLFAERFDQAVPDFSPVGRSPGWQVRALHDGKVVDYTRSTPSDQFPFLSRNPSVPGVGGPGYLVLGSGGSISNVLAWVECRLDLQDTNPASISFYTKNDLASATERVVVRIGSEWFASVATFQDEGGSTDWKLNLFEFSPGPNQWHSLNTNSLALTSPRTALPKGIVNGIGLLGQSPGAGKIRVDEIQVLRGSVLMDPVYRVGSWIWADAAQDRQTCRFWTAFEIPRKGSVNKARLRMTADNFYEVFLDGVKVGQGSEWRRLTEYDLTLLLPPGPHVLAVEAFNEVGGAGIVAGVAIDFDDGSALEIPSDASWRVVPEGYKGWRTRSTPHPGWPQAQVVARLHDMPGFPERPPVLFPSALQPQVIRFWQRGWFQITLLGFCTVIGVFYLRLLARMALQSRAQQALQRERARIARDIHDDLGAGLTQLVLLGEAEQREMAGDPEKRAKFERISEAGRRLLRSIDEVVWLVNSQRDSLQDFEAYVCRYAENFLRSSSIRCRLDVDAEVPPSTFDLASRRSLFLAIKESLNNVARHSGATEVSLAIQAEDDEVRVIIQDNGKGFDTSRRKPERNGTSNMTQRMAEVGGEFRITSQPGAGCRVELVVPLTERRRAGDRWWNKRRSTGSAEVN